MTGTDLQAEIEKAIQLLEEDIAAAVAEERAAVVAYLSECAQGGDTFGPRGSGDHLRLLATNIQRGWHRREEEP
jgi:hypothetical protein